MENRKEKIINHKGEKEKKVDLLFLLDFLTLEDGSNWLPQKTSVIN